MQKSDNNLIAPLFDRALDSIGNTPMLKVTRLDTGCCELFLKLENLIEATAGNTGLGLALVAAQMGFKLILVVPDKMAQEKIFHLKALGTDVRLTRSDVGKGHPEYYQENWMQWFVVWDPVAP